jgi:alpha-glucosidase (family GH31 glycosyl hydrolase)
MPSFKDQSNLTTNFTSIWVKDFAGNPFTGWCWPGNSRWVDFLNPNGRQFWVDQM